MTRSMSSFDGHIAEVPGVSVDNFESLDKRAYFLSHCHRDHTQGLTNPLLRKYLTDNNFYIYTSELSAGIISATTDFVDVKERVKILKFGSSTLIKLDATEHHQEILVEVTTIPAGHCFGSVMFLFRTPYKCILFTGDFRLSISDVCKLSQLHKKDEPIRIDKMYVDTTFFNAEYEQFPKRSDSVEYAVEEIKKWMDADNGNHVALHPSARFGYEYVFNEIFKKLKIKVYINDEDWQLYSSYQSLVPGTTNDWKTTRIHKCRNRTENYPHNCIPQNAKKFLYVHLSAMKWSNFTDEDPTYSWRNDRRLDICFPTHCSKSEIVHFVSYFSPTTVVGFPNPYVVDDVRQEQKIVFKAKRRRLCGAKKV